MNFITKNMSVVDTLREISHKFQGPEEYLKNHGFSVEYGSRDELTQATNVIGCGDDRNQNHGPTLFGSLWQVAATKTGGDSYGIIGAIDLARHAGLEPTYHPHCGFYEAWISGQIKTPFSLATSSDELENILWTINKEEYHGNHSSHVLTLNYVPGFTASPSGTYRTDIWVARRLGIPDFRAVDVAAQTAKILGVRTVHIIK